MQRDKHFRLLVNVYVDGDNLGVRPPYSCRGRGGSLCAGLKRLILVI